MMTTNTFWKLVRHEYVAYGNRRKFRKRRVSGKWWVAYIILVILSGFVAFPFLAGMDDFHLENLWFFSLGLPYIIFFIGYGLVKKEWDNETQGFWLTLPYSRFTLIGAKFVGSFLQTLTILIGVYLLACIYAVYLVFIVSSLTTSDLLEFITVGFDWIFIMACLSPLILSLGITTAVTPYTAIRPIVPLLWMVFMSSGSLVYWGLGSFDKNFQVFDQFIGGTGQEAGLFSFSLLTFGLLILSWILCFFIIRVLGYLLNKKLSL